MPDSMATLGRITGRPEEIATRGRPFVLGSPVEQGAAGIPRDLYDTDAEETLTQAYIHARQGCLRALYETGGTVLLIFEPEQASYRVSANTYERFLSLFTVDDGLELERSLDGSKDLGYIGRVRSLIRQTFPSFE